MDAFPFPGLENYREELTDVFFGREPETGKLHQLVSLEQAVVLHGNEETGKTSLIQAGLIPGLLNETDKAYKIHLIDFENIAEEPVNDLCLHICKIIEGKIPNQPSCPLDKLEVQKPTFWTILKKKQCSTNGQSRFVIIFDHFDLINNYPESQITEFKKQLSECLYTKIPQHFRNQISEISDKKKEIFSEEELEIFYTPLDVRVIFVVDSQNLNLLNRITDYIPNILRYSFELLPVTEEQVRYILMNIASLKSQNNQSLKNLLYEPSIEVILSFFKKQHEGFDLVQLQMILKQIVRNKIILKSESNIDLTDFLTGFYQSQVNELGFPDKEETLIKRLLEKGMIADKRRKELSETVILKDFEVEEHQLIRLHEANLLKRRYDANQHFYRLSHKALVSPIIKTRQIIENKDRKNRQIRNVLLITSIVAFLILISVYYNLRIERKTSRQNEILFLTSKAENLIGKDALKSLILADSCYREMPDNPFVLSVLEKSYYAALLDSIPFYNLFLKGHRSYINSITFSKDGKWILTGSGDRNAMLWDINGNLLQTFVGHSDDVIDAQFFKGNDSIVTLSKDSTIKFWRIYTDTAYRTIHLPNNPIKSLYFQNATPEKPALFKKYPGLIHRFSPDSVYLAASTEDYTIKIWNLKNIILDTLIILKHNNIVHDAVFSNNNKYVLTSSFDNCARLWDIEGHLLATLVGHKGYVYNALFSFDDTKIVTCSADKTAIVWDLNGNAIKTLTGHKDTIWNAKFLPDGNHVLTCSKDCTAIIWNLKDNTYYIVHHKGEITNINFDSSGKYVLTSSEDSTTRVWDTTGKLLSQIVHQDYVRDAVFSVDGRNILTCSDDKCAKISDIQGNTLKILEKHPGTIYSAYFSTDMSKALTSSHDGTAMLWYLKENKTTLFYGHTARIINAIFSDDNKYILTASYDNTARLWDQYANSIYVFKHKQPVENAWFSPDGKRIVTCSQDKTAIIWLSPEGIHERVTAILKKVKHDY
jgi:WD40 repeat protein